MERYERAKAAVEQLKEQATKREAELQRLLHHQMTKLQEAENNVAAAIRTTQDIVAAQIESLNKEIVELQTRSSQFLHSLDESEQERSRLADSLHEHQINATLELKRQHDQYLKESAESTHRLLRRFDQLTHEMEAKLATLDTCKIIKAKL